MKHRTTIKDIAKELGISPSTVSRALKNHPDISEKTRKMVFETAKRLNYRPNPIARSLKMQQNKTIGVIVPQIVHYFFSSIISGIEDFAYEKGYSVVMLQSNESYEREKSSANFLLNNGVAGVLVSRTKETTDFSHFQELIDFGIPIVFFDRFCPSIKTDKVIINDEYAAFIATEHLIKTGCRRIIHFRGPKKLKISTRRETGYLEAFREYNLPIDNNLIIECDSFEKAQKITKDLIDNNFDFDGIFAVNDESAAGAIMALKDANVKIPEEVSVVGYSNDLISRIIEPQLTTIDQRGYDMGQMATKLLLERIETDKELRPRTEVIPTRLILRNSTRKILE